MVKMTLTDGKTNVTQESELVLAFAFAFNKEEGADENTARVGIDVHILGKGNTEVFLVETCKVLGGLVNTLRNDQHKRAKTYIQMLDALRDGFDGKGFRKGEGEVFIEEPVSQKSADQ